jgi:2'-5' RNA ligase
MVEVLALPFLDPAAPYLGAIVFPLPPSLESYVNALRNRWSETIGVPEQTAPHLTLLFLGITAGREQMRTHAAFSELGISCVEIDVLGLDTFDNNGVVTNIHIRIAKSSGLEGLHDSAVAAYKEFPWGESAMDSRPYVPHISIVEGIALSRRAAADLLEAAAPPESSFVLSNAFHFVRPMRRRSG